MYAAIQVGVENFRTQQSPTPGGVGGLGSPEFIYTKVGRRLIKLDWSAVYQLESVKNYVLLRTAEHPYGLPLRSSLVSVLHTMLPAAQRTRFVQISRSLVLDRGIIRSYSETQVETRYEIFKCTMRFWEGPPGGADGV